MMLSAWLQLRILQILSKRATGIFLAFRFQADQKNWSNFRFCTRRKRIKFFCSNFQFFFWLMRKDGWPHHKHPNVTPPPNTPRVSSGLRRGMKFTARAGWMTTQHQFKLFFKPNDWLTECCLICSSESIPQSYFEGRQKLRYLNSFLMKTCSKVLQFLFQFFTIFFQSRD
jgi:hypothetical protein